MSTFKIERGIPIPGYRNQSRYPFANMKVNDSFVANSNIALSARRAAYIYGSLHDKKFTVRKINARGDMRIWRIK